MEEFNDFDKLKKVDFYKQHGCKCLNDNRSYFYQKDKKVRMLDENNIIKKYKSELPFLNNLLELKVDGVITPDKVLIDKDNNYYIICKFLQNNKTLNYYINANPSTRDFLNIINNLLFIVDDCHKKDFYLVDINLTNVLINNMLEPSIVDYDTSCFIKNNEFISNNNKINSYLKDEFISIIINKFFYDKDLNDITNLKEIFNYLDKIEIVCILIEYFLDKLNINYAYMEYLVNYDLIKKIKFPLFFEEQLIEILKNREVENLDNIQEYINRINNNHFVKKRKIR